MKLGTFFFIALLVGLVGGSITLALCIENPPPGALGFHVMMGVVIGIIPFMCLIGLLMHRHSEIEDIEIKFTHRYNNEAIRRNQLEQELMSRHEENVEVFQDRRSALVEKIAVLAGWVHATRQPTNETMRKIRTRLVDLAILELKTGVPIKVLTDNVHPDMIRDIVEAAIKSGDLDLAKGDKWVGELVQFALAEKSAPQAPADPPAA